MKPSAKKITIAVTITLLILSLVFAVTVCAEKTTDEKREDAKWRIDLIRKGLIAQELDLDEATLAKLTTLSDSHEKEMRAIMEERKKLMKDLETALEKEKVSDSEVKGIINKLVTAEEKIVTLRKKELGELEKILTTEQIGRYIIFNERFKREIRKLVRKVGDQGPPPPH
jgi:Spy/CpxP family protein refolding chaperone